MSPASSFISILQLLGVALLMALMSDHDMLLVRRPRVARRGHFAAGRGQGIHKLVAIAGPTALLAVVTVTPMH